MSDRDNNDHNQKDHMNPNPTYSVYGIVKEHRDVGEYLNEQDKLFQAFF